MIYDINIYLNNFVFKHSVSITWSSSFCISHLIQSLLVLISVSLPSMSFSFYISVDLHGLKNIGFFGYLSNNHSSFDFVC